MHTLHRLWVALAYHWVWHGRRVVIGEDLTGYWALQARWSHHEYARVHHDGSWVTYSLYDVRGQCGLPVTIGPTRDSWYARQVRAKQDAVVVCIRQKFI